MLVFSLCICRQLTPVTLGSSCSLHVYDLFAPCKTLPLDPGMHALVVWLPRGQIQACIGPRSAQDHSLGNPRDPESRRRQWTLGRHGPSCLSLSTVMKSSGRCPWTVVPTFPLTGWNPGPAVCPLCTSPPGGPQMIRGQWM